MTKARPLFESSFVQELTAELKRRNPDYQAWMISVTDEVEKRTQSARQNLLWPLSR